MTSRRTFLQAMAAAQPMFAAAARPQVGFATGTYGMKTMPVDAALRTLAEIGYDGVEICLMAGWPTEPVASLRKMISETGIAVPAMIENLPASAVPEKRAHNIERLKRAVSLAAGIAPSNPPVVESILGGSSADWENSKAMLVDELGEWMKIAEDSKVTVCFKPHASQLVNSPERTLWLLNQVPSPHLKIVYDYSHFGVEGFPLESSLKQLLPHTAFISVKDFRGTADKHEYLLPGDGATDYLEYFRLLKTVRYSGFVIVEVSAMIHQKPGYDPVSTARLCYDRLAPLFAQAALDRPAHLALQLP